MTTKQYIELLADNLELRKAQASRLGDLNSALRIIRRYHVPENNPEVQRLKDKQRKIKSMLEWCDRLMNEQEFYDLSEGDVESNAEWIEWWSKQKDIEL